MRIGIGIALPGRHGSSSLGPIAVIDFTTATPGAMSNAAFLSAYGLGFQRASAGTVQMTASTVDSTPGVDVARIGGVGASWGTGFCFEETRQNDQSYSRDYTKNGVSQWAAGGATLTPAFANSPDGTVSGATHATVISGAFGVASERAQGTAGANITGSGWVRTTAGTAANNNSSYDNGTRRASAATSTTAWGRVSVTASGAAAPNQGAISLADGRDWSGVGGIAAGARDFVVDMAQQEAGAFATEWIFTGIATATRAGERLFKSSPTSWLSSGTLNLELKFVAKGSSTQYTSNLRLWTDASDATTYIEISATTRLLTYSMHGTTWTSAVPMSWNAQDVIQIFVPAGGATTPSYRVNGGAAVRLGTTPPFGTLAFAGALDLLCSGTTLQTTSWLQTITVWPLGAGPAWAL